MQLHFLLKHVFSLLFPQSQLFFCFLPTISLQVDRWQLQLLLLPVLLLLLLLLLLLAD